MSCWYKTNLPSGGWHPSSVQSAGGAEGSTGLRPAEVRTYQQGGSCRGRQAAAAQAEDPRRPGRSCSCTACGLDLIRTCIIQYRERNRGTQRNFLHLDFNSNNVYFDQVEKLLIEQNRLREQKRLQDESLALKEKELQLLQRMYPAQPKVTAAFSFFFF